MVQQRRWVKEETLNAFLDAGFNRAQVLGVIVITALKTISNYSNHLAGTPLDAAFTGQKWTRPNGSRSLASVQPHTVILVGAGHVHLPPTPACWPASREST